MKTRLDLAPGPTAIAAFHERLLRTMLDSEGLPSPEREATERLSRDYHPEALRLAAQTWQKRMVHEYESAAVFAQILPQLMEAGATIDFQTTVLRCAMDELHHATLCAQVVAFLGRDPSVEVDNALVPVPRHQDCTPRVGALRNLLFASLTETISMGLLTEERERVAEPFVARVLRRLASDESLHARVGWTYLAVLHADLQEDERAQLQAYLPVALGHLEQEMLQAMPLGSGTMPPKPVMDDLFALGFSAGNQARELMYQAIEEVVLPRLEAFGLEAHAAWNARPGHT